METLENELKLLISKVENANNFCSEIENIQNVYPFNKYEYIITKLVEEKVLSYDDYLELRNDYINRNLYLGISKNSVRFLEMPDEFLFKSLYHNDLNKTSQIKSKENLSKLKFLEVSIYMFLKFLHREVLEIHGDSVIYSP